MTAVESAAPAAARGGDTAVAELRVTEIFRSIQGEGLTAGVPTAFIRLTGCPLRCRYCDTAYAFSGGQRLTVAQVVAAVVPLNVPWVTVTGGEPLAQPNCHLLLRALCDAGYQVSLETSGERDIAAVDSRVARVMDLKTPGSGEASRNRLQNLEHLVRGDQIKFVICDRIDYQWSREMVRQYRLPERCTVLFSPAWGELAPGELADWVLQDALDVRVQVQLHKIFWGDVPGR